MTIYRSLVPSRLRTTGIYRIFIPSRATEFLCLQGLSVLEITGNFMASRTRSTGSCVLTFFAFSDCEPINVVLLDVAPLRVPSMVTYPGL